MRGVQVAFFGAAIALFAVAAANNSKQCKNIARDVIMNSCKGPRHKRSQYDTDYEPPAYAPATRSPPPRRTYEHEYRGDSDDYKKEKDYHGLGFFQKQMSYGLNLGKPFFRRAEDDYSEHHTEHGSRYARGAEPHGFNLSPEDLEELYEQVGHRLPRNNKKDSMKIFQRVASICCGNAKLCYDDPSRVPCFEK